MTSNRVQNLLSRNTRNLSDYRKIHQTKSYGRSSEQLVPVIKAAIKASKDFRVADLETLLDFGCGQSKAAIQVGHSLNIEPHLYDPAIAELSTIPEKNIDLIINTDVLEHLDTNEIPGALCDIKAISDYAFFNIATSRSGAFLPSGENAHATVRDSIWWQAKLAEYFPIVQPLSAQKNRCSFVTWNVSTIGLLLVNMQNQRMRLAKKFLKLNYKLLAK